jgi:hypothetical protein
VKYVVSMEWVSTQHKQFQRMVNEYEKGNLKQDAKWLKRRPTAKPPAKKCKTVEEDYNNFSDEDTVDSDSDDDFEFDE